MRAHPYTGRRASRVLLRLLSLCLILVLVFGAVAPAGFAVMPTRGDMLRYIPVVVSVDANNVVVYGYFTNLNPDCTVSNFRDFELAVFMDNTLIASGTFGTLKPFTIPAEGALNYNFEFPGRNGLYPGTYICEDDDVAIMSCTFDYSELLYKPSIK